MSLGAKNKYKAKCKVSDTKFVTYSFNNPDKFYSFIINKFPDFRFANVFEKKTEIQVFSIKKDGSRKYDNIKNNFFYK